MMFNLTTNKSKQQFLAEMGRQMSVLENSFIKLLKPFLNSIYIESAKWVKRGHIQQIDHIIDKSRYRLYRLLENNYKRTLFVFGTKAFDRIDDLPKSSSDYKVKTIEDVFWEELNQWIEEETASKVLLISATTRRALRKIIQQGMNEGLSHQEVARKIFNTGKISTPYRAKTIALTETHTAAVKAVDTAIKSTGLVAKKEWVAALTKRTRPWHLEVSGTIIPDDEYFIVKGKKMKMPGDPAGGPENVIRCRCVLAYKLVKSLKRNRLAS